MLKNSTTSARLLSRQGNDMKEVSMGSDDFSIHRKYAMGRLLGHGRLCSVILLPQEKRNNEFDGLLCRQFP